MKHAVLATISLFAMGNVLAHDSHMEYPSNKFNQNAISTSSSHSKSSAYAQSNSRSKSNSKVSESNNASQSVNTYNPRQAASAANITLAPTAVCSGTTSAGGQGSAFGISFGTSWTDNNCMLLEQVRATAALGHADVAAEMMCTIPNYREAREVMGYPCFRRKKVEHVSKNDGWDHNDPIIRARMGLPPQ